MLQFALLVGSVTIDSFDSRGPSRFGTPCR
jgi:hypothetical protein